MRFNSQHMPMETFELLNSRYNIIDAINFKHIDHDWNLLRQWFAKHYREKFDSNDRFIIEHQDTDIYLDLMPVGVNLRNFFLIADEYDFPFYTFIFWTNHFGIQNEIDILCQRRHVNDRPSVIESFCCVKHVFDVIHDRDIDIDSIEYHGLSMMGNHRSHRFALYHALRDISTDKLAMSIQGVTK